ncbi:ATP-binding protein [Dinoroseobacter sp. S375]|uniref:ATP-binding protein n=1 Tax=Dinoroseobacter sp. S375 TaxID=3415136 RepID=UPI003C7C44AD
MLSLNLLVVISLAYVVFLFAVAFVAERRASQGKIGWLRAPMIYTLSLSVYCTAWTFYGAVGYAARSGLEFVTIYLGPTLVFVGWWWLLRKLVRIGRAQRITSIADLISSRYGKSNGLAVIVTVVAVIASAPYIALQLQSVSLSLAVFGAEDMADLANPVDGVTDGLWVAIGLAIFTVLFGTRNLDVNERHHGVVMAIAVEAIVKLVALLAVGVFVVWGIGGGVADVLARIDASPVSAWEVQGGRWVGLIFVSAAAVICLPRMFQVLVVENADESHLSTASWAFPAYLMLMSLFVIPIAVVGLDIMPEGANPDLFVLTLPLSQDQNTLAALAFLGGFSSATSMVIVAAIALSTMVSNHLIMPVWLSFQDGGKASVSGDVRRAMLLSRRVSIAAVLGLGFAYYAVSESGEALAAIGLISFVGAAQILPALLGGIFWRGATRRGAVAGLVAGFALWGYTLYLPSLAVPQSLFADIVAHGPLGIGFLKPHALFGLTGLDPLVHTLLWSMVVNGGLFLGVSLLSFPSPMERLQGAQFVNVFEHSSTPRSWAGGRAEAEDLLIMAQRILGPQHAQSVFVRAAAEQGKTGYLPDTTPEFLVDLERELAGSVGAATAHAMIAQINGGAAVSVRELMAVADETAQMMEYSSQLEAKSRELEATASKLREANEKLTELSIQKDAFLSQISHELRTPMTSIRSFSEILMEGTLESAAQTRYSTIIHDESLRLTRLLDDLLDLSVLENGQVVLNPQEEVLSDLLDRALSATAAGRNRPLKVLRDPDREDHLIHTDTDRLVQVFINIIANTIKYCDADEPELTIRVGTTGAALALDFIDNGSGIPARSQSVIFEKFARLDDQSKAGGAGLGLAICREVMVKLGGSISYLRGQKGAAFRVTFPMRISRAVA